MNKEMSPLSHLLKGELEYQRRKRFPCGLSMLTWKIEVKN